MFAPRRYYWSFKLLSIWGLLLATFALPHLPPGSPLTLYEAWPGRAEQRLRLITAYGLDRPLPVQYVIWMQRLITGQWGNSRYYNRPVFRDTLRATGFTLLLLSWTGLACGIGTVALKGMSRLLGRLGISPPGGSRLAWLEVLPSFLVAILLHDVAVWQFGWVGLMNVSLFSPYYFLNPLIMLLPASALALIPLIVWHASRSPAPLDQQTSKWRRLGLQWRRYCLLFRPLLGYFVMEVVLTERIFALPGLGSFGIEGLRRRDFPVLQGFMLGLGILYIVLLCLLDRGINHAQSTFSSRRQGVHSVPRTMSFRRAVYSGVWGMIVLLALAAWAPQLWPHDPTEIHAHDQLLLPNSRYILGTDFLGRDVLSRTIHGFRSSMPRIMLIAALTTVASWLLMGLKHILPGPCKLVWDGGLTLFDALPPFLLAAMAFVAVEHRPWPLETTLIIACLPIACKLIASKSNHARVGYTVRVSPPRMQGNAKRTSPSREVWLRDVPWRQIAILAYLSELVLLLEVSFFYLNLSPESLAPTWGSDIRVGMQYSHINIWVVVAPALAVIWSRYIFHRLRAHFPAVVIPQPLDGYDGVGRDRGRSNRSRPATNITRLMT
jgi:peptide/nickel transport system permease protein